MTVIYHAILGLTNYLVPVFLGILVGGWWPSAKDNTPYLFIALFLLTLTNFVAKMKLDGKEKSPDPHGAQAP